MPPDTEPSGNPRPEFSTELRGKPTDHVDGASEESSAGLSPSRPADPDPVRTALAGAQKISRSNAAIAPSRNPRRQSRRGGGERGGYSGAGPDDTDPQLVTDVVAGFVTDRGWQLPLAQARLFSDWTGIVGADVAAHCTPAVLRERELRISAESTAWATQLRLLAGTLLARIVAELGPDVVTSVRITGPAGPSWSHGPRAVRGARGPRDTYG